MSEPAKIPPSPTELERQRFEEWGGSKLRTDERGAFLARSLGGDYVLATARAGWAAWCARRLIDDLEASMLRHWRAWVLVDREGVFQHVLMSEPNAQTRANWAQCGWQYVECEMREKISP